MQSSTCKTYDFFKCFLFIFKHKENIQKVEIYLKTRNISKNYNKHYQFIYNFGSALLIFSLVATAIVYIFQGGIHVTRSGVQMISATRLHLSVLGGLFLGWLGFHYHLEKYNLLFSE